MGTVVFDKTGTLTLGNPAVTSIVAAQGHTDQEVLQFAAIAEQRSEHPLGKAIVSKAAEAGLVVTAPENSSIFPAQVFPVLVDHLEILVGSQAFLQQKRVDLNAHAARTDHWSEILVASNGQYVGAIRIADALRPQARDAVRALHAMGLKTVLLTGDARRVADATAKEVGIDEIYAEVLPDEKNTIIKQFIRTGRKVAMVGDGINDAPALMQATVGIAMGSGTEVARESANIMLIGNDLRRLVDTIKISRRCHRIIMQNFVGTLTVDSIGVGLAAFGLLNPLFAAFIHVVSELTFILNSARLLPGTQRRRVSSGSAASATSAD